MSDLSGSWTVPQEPEPIVEWLHGRLMGLPNVQVYRSGPATLDVTSKYTPVWAIVVAVVLFPIGLLALIAKDSVTLRLHAAPGPAGGSVVWLQGDGSKHLSRRLQECYAQLQPVTQPAA
jgi:hypothetical protein